MNDYKTILELIETVDPADTEKLDEIDARVYAYIHDLGLKYVSHEQKLNYILVHSKLSNGDDHWEQLWNKYTRSRDALKAIRPIGWSFGIDGINDEDVDGHFEAWIYNNLDDHFCDRLESPHMKTEELAELHVIIQAIAYERGE